MLTVYTGIGILHFINSTQPKENKMYQVINYRQGNKVVGTYKTRTTARRAVDRLDNAYGAYSYRVIEINI